MELQKIIREFLNVIDFKLYSFNDDSIIIQDIKNPNRLYQILILPIDFQSNDDLRIFRSTKLNLDNYCIDVLNTKYPKVPFSKNGIDFFTISTRRDEENDYFSSELYHNDSLYITYIGKNSGHNYLSYRKCDDNGIIDVFYGLDCDNRYLEIYIRHLPSIDKKICISESISNGQRIAILVVKDNNQEVYRQEIKDNEIEIFFHALAYKSKNIVEQANNGIRTLNNNIFEMVFDYHNIAKEFLNMINNSTGSTELIDDLFEKYFGQTILNKKSENEILLQRKLPEELTE